MAKAVDVQKWPVFERPCSTDRMYAGDETPRPFPVIPGIQFRPVAAMTAIECKAVTPVCVQCCPVDEHGGNDRYFLFCQFHREAVLLCDGLVRPAAGPVEFCDDRCAVFYTHLVNTVLIAVERDKPAVTPVTALFDGIQQGIGCQLSIVCRGRVDLGAPSQCM